VFEVFDLAEAFLGGGLGFVGAAEILSFFGENFVAAGYFFDHEAPRYFDAVADDD
jgi:hypothetical protein